MNISIVRIAGGLHIDQAPLYLTKYLKYSHRKIEFKNFKKQPTFEERLLYQLDGKGGLVTLQGFFTKICELIHKNHDTFNIVDERTVMPDIDWATVKKVGLKDYQIDATVDFLIQGLTNSGIVNCTGGWGKTYAQAFTYAAWHSLNTILAIPLAEVFRKTYKDFCTIFPDKHIGRVGDGYNDISTDITISTFRSLNKCATEKCELLLIDEIQGTSGDVIQDIITSMMPRRLFGYTATDEGLFNNADKVIKGLFGERLIYIPYDEALNLGAVVPGLVYFIKTSNVLITAKTFDGMMSQGIKCCKPRNELIGKICTLLPKGWPALVFVEHIQDHLINLHKCMPQGAQYVHRESSKDKLGDYALTSKRQKEITNEFSNNGFNILIATDAFKAGVDIPHLRVVVQASGGSSKIEIVQEALRGSRVLPDKRKQELGIIEDKTHFVLIDFLDNHDERLENMARNRMELYKEQGWKIKIVDHPEDIDWYDYANNSVKL